MGGRQCLKKKKQLIITFFSLASGLIMHTTRNIDLYLRINQKDINQRDFF